MTDSLEQLARDTINDVLAKTSPEERLKGLSAEEIVRALPPEILAAVRQIKDNGSPPKPE